MLALTSGLVFHGRHFFVGNLEVGMRLLHIILVLDRF